VVEVRRRRLAIALRVLAAVAGTLPVAILGALCAARFLPVPEELRFVLGSTLLIPSWVAAMCVAFLSQDAARAWIWCASLALILGVVVFVIPR